jgi:hypothetical protein
VEDKDNSYKAGVSGTVKVKETSQPLKAEVSFNRFTLAENRELGTEVSEITFIILNMTYRSLSCQK